MSQAMAALFQRITTGVYIVGVADSTRHNAFTAAWVMPVSFQPLLLALSINPRHSSYALLQAGKGFTVNVLRRDQIALAAHFGGPNQGNKLDAVSWHLSANGLPLLDDVAAHFECELSAEHPAGDHSLIVGRVINGCLLQPEAKLLGYQHTGDLDGASKIFPATF